MLSRITSRVIALVAAVVVVLVVVLNMSAQPHYIFSSHARHVWRNGTDTAVEAHVLPVPMLLRPIPRLNATLLLVGVRKTTVKDYRIGYAHLDPYVASVFGGAAEDAVMIQFVGILEDKTGHLQKNYVQYMPHAPAVDLLRPSLVVSLSPHDPDETLPCSLVTLFGSNIISCLYIEGVTAMRLVDAQYELFMDVAVVPAQQVVRNVTLCVAFLMSPQEKAIVEFVHYHALMGVDRFVFYDRFGDRVAFLKALALTMMEHYNVEVVAVHWPGVTVDYDYVRRGSNYYDQIVTLTHCQYQYMLSSRWVATWDLDEYFHSVQGYTIPVWIDAIETKSASTRSSPVAGVRIASLYFAFQGYDSNRLVTTQFGLTGKNSSPKLVFNPVAIAAVTNHFAYALLPYEEIGLDRHSPGDISYIRHYVNLFHTRMDIKHPDVATSIKEHRPALTPETVWYVNALVDRLARHHSDLFKPCPKTQQVVTDPERLAAANISLTSGSLHQRTYKNVCL